MCTWEKLEEGDDVQNMYHSLKELIINFKEQAEEISNAKTKYVIKSKNLHDTS